MESSTVDGVRVRFNNDEGEYVGWYLARKSNTEPVLVMRMEATTEEQLASMKALADERVSSIINIESMLNA
jgi:phosphomannomutase